MYHPTTRVLAVLELLQTHGRLSGAEMSARLAVDARTLRRYIVTLEDIGIPIVSERGRHGGYALMPGFKLPPMMFSDEEALALSVGLLAAQSLGFSAAAPAVESARAKLERIMPDRLKQRVRAVDQTVRLDLLRPASGADREALVMLSSAAVAQQRIYLEYRALDGRASEREFDPYGLVLWERCWYALGMCHLRGEMRSFRLDRIVRTEPRAVQFTRPPGFDALDYLRRSFKSMPRAHRIEVLLHTDLEAASRCFFDVSALFEQTAGGVLLRTSTDHIDWFAGLLAGMGCEFEVLHPPSLRDSVQRLGQRLLRAGMAPVQRSST
ncbi:YafY family protein [Massilia sp. CF038]|uniref:helix-turn-helix transcriptional regulator n=1 Tax=Massilia sp. CF038 TaxID=1881045 RepID=UPI00091B4640|nr:YafY family protein [Massilia sp. CF038]SHG74196.1 transcriptional regulator [Massilia sp. CF038]